MISEILCDIEDWSNDAKILYFTVLLCLVNKNTDINIDYNSKCNSILNIHDIWSMNKCIK